jgi:hypothetical protein
LSESMGANATKAVLALLYPESPISILMNAPS